MESQLLFQRTIVLLKSFVRKRYTYYYLTILEFSVFVMYINLFLKILLLIFRFCLLRVTL
jgi:hypothetical protein